MAAGTSSGAGVAAAGAQLLVIQQLSRELQYVVIGHFLAKPNVASDALMPERCAGAAGKNSSLGLSRLYHV